VNIGRSREPGDHRISFLWWLAIACVAIAAVLITMSLQLNRNLTAAAELRAEVTRSYETRAELSHILTLHQDIETGQRGFLLTGDPEFLEPYHAAARSIEASFARLSADEPAGRSPEADLTELRQASQLKREFAARTIALARAGNFSQARQAVTGGVGKRQMDRIRAGIARIDGYERVQLEERTRAAQAIRADVRWRIFGLQGLLFTLLIISVGFLVRMYRGWQRTLDREQVSNARHEAIFTSARDGMVVINASGSIESLNPAAAAMFGYSQEELIRRDVSTLLDLAPHRGEVETFLKRLAAGRFGVAGEVHEFVGRCRDGNQVPLEISVSPVTLGDSLVFLAVLRDVTERRQVDQMKTEFVSTVSHELRTPLTSISGSLGLIAGGAAGELPERAQRLIEIAQSNCARLIRLINDILDIEKIESGRITFQSRHLSLERLLHQSIDGIRPFAAPHKVTIELDEIPPRAVIIGDEDRVMQVFTNLLSNAVKFSPPGEEVRITVMPLGRRYRVSVTDRGPGISEEFRTRIFGKFAQADASDTRQKGGTGLGLNIVAQIVDRLGGAVSYDSVPGEGATFHVDLPAVAIEQPEDQPAALSGEGDGQGEETEPAILHVDDDPDMLRIVCSALEGSARVYSSPSLADARRALRRERFDAVILDIGMADGNGLQLVPLIRERVNVPIILFTAQDADESQVEQVDAVFVKSRDSLDKLIKEVVRRARQARQGNAYQGRERRRPAQQERQE
jgi:PAS domain S-box-containing protein